MATIDDRLKELFSTMNSEDSELQKFEKSSKEFEEMVSKGIVKKRGYTLLTVDGASQPSLSFNNVGLAVYDIPTI